MLVQNFLKIESFLKKRGPKLPFHLPTPLKAGLSGSFIAAHRGYLLTKMSWLAQKQFLQFYLLYVLTFLQFFLMS